MLYYDSILATSQSPAIDATFQANVIDVAAANGFTLPSDLIPKLNDLMIGAKSSGIFAKSDFFFIHVFQNNALLNLSRIDWKRNGVLSTNVGSGVTMVNNGLRKGSATGYIDIGYNPAVDKVNLSLNSAGYGFLTSQEGSGTFVFGQILGGATPTTGNNNFFRSNFGETSSSAIINGDQATSLNSVNPGYGTINRTSATSVQLNWRAMAAQNVTANSVDIKTGPTTLFRRQNSYAAEGTEVSLFHGGAAYTNAETQAFRTVLANYLTSIGSTVQV